MSCCSTTLSWTLTSYATQRQPGHSRPRPPRRCGHLDWSHMRELPAGAPAGLEHLPVPELTSLALAWDAMLAGTIPIGAVVVDEAGQIIGAGRNAIFGEPAEGSLSGSHLAHAE